MITGCLAARFWLLSLMGLWQVSASLETSEVGRVLESSLPGVTQLAGSSEEVLAVGGLSTEVFESLPSTASAPQPPVSDPRVQGTSCKASTAWPWELHATAPTAFCGLPRPALIPYGKNYTRAWKSGQAHCGPSWRLTSGLLPFTIITYFFPDLATAIPFKLTSVLFFFKAILNLAFCDFLLETF